MSLLQFTEKGIYCERANVYIDPWKPVNYAIITHAHADHSRWGNKFYLCHHLSKPIIQHRLGGDIHIESMEYLEKKSINGVEFSFFPAGHIIGSAQVRVAYKGEVWVASGDYKLEDDGFSTPFEPIKCNTFITECTFGLPVFKWQDQKEVFEDINNWWRKNKEEDKVTILTGYSLGKAQRLIQGVDPSIGKIFTHGAIEKTNEIIRNMGVGLNETTYVTPEINKKDFKGALVIAPPSALGTSWQKKFQPFEVGIASGWMKMRGPRRRRSVDRGFVLSDHADWDGLNTAIKATECEKVIVTHGYTNIFSKWLNDQGIETQIEATEFEGEQLEATEKTDAE
ncbi:ligase-associated DNA damage response exonuclease [Cyclobacterium qasimii]|uniref:mRNA 3-end processing factor n=2 Tax=Cyclobacterium qasimii TaxID=1350429 RepID=S7VNJ0_9BACT|nr:ligase-associated DNA damage response exonuclease [Cyclobacterium qasimii]EPR70947.1 mRNA 3-end processing factor [Cyclobacterium qasimii M12-11B]GEO19894.1 DNA ligase-associated DEXH box helicase [Cyclobacterium qasimii]